MGTPTKVGAGSGTTGTCKFAVAVKPFVSVKLTTNTFVPISEFVGVPDRIPFVDTVSHPGPLTLPKVSASPGSATAKFAMPVFKYGRQATVDGRVITLVVKIGTVIWKIVPPPPPAEGLKPAPPCVVVP